MMRTKRAGSEPMTRRTEGRQARGRAARVVTDVLRATAEELGRVGYAALRIEDVAMRSGVNKTTIYRRWPTKTELVIATMRQIAVDHLASDTGSLRGDLIEQIGITVAWATSPTGRGIMRMMQVGRADQEVEAIATAIREENHERRLAPIQRGIARGELPEGTNPELVSDLVYSPIGMRLLRNEPITEAYIAAVVDVVLAGAGTGAAKLNTRLHTRHEDEEGA